jgi:hypothetical protein
MVERGELAMCYMSTVRFTIVRTSRRPGSAPRTAFNSTITAHRRFAQAVRAMPEVIAADWVTGHHKETSSS